MGFGYALFQPVNSNAVLSSAPTKFLGATSGILSVANQLAISVGVSFGSLALDIALAHRGIERSPASGAWTKNPAETCAAFTHVWGVVAVITLLAVFTSLMRGKGANR